MISPLSPTRTRRSGVLRGVAACTIVVGTAMCAVGCGAGFNSASLQVEPNSGSAQIGALRVNGVVVVADPVSHEAEIVAAVANMSPGSNQLVSVTAGGSSATVRPATSLSPLSGLPGNNFTVAGNSVTIAGGSAVSFGQPGRPALEISGASLVPGHFTQVEFGFAGLGQTTVNALIMPNSGLFKSYNLGPAASPTPSVRVSVSVSSSLSASPRAAASPGLSPSPSLSASVTASPGSSVSASATPSVAAAEAHLHGSREPRP